MKLENLALYLFSALVLSGAFASCSKSDKYDDVTKPSLNGELYFVSPAYIAPGDVLDFTPKGAVHPDGGDMGYYWLASGIQTTADTTRHIGDPASVKGGFSITVPDSLYTIRVTCVAFAGGYNNMYAYRYIKVVKDESLTGIDHPEGETSFTDDRDGKKYGYVSHDGLDWMNTNLRYADSGRPYSDCSVMTEIFGNLYTWEEASSACPEGWRLPSEDEFKELCGGSFISAAGGLMADAYFNSEKMWEYWPAVKVTNASGMNMIPVGYGYYTGSRWSYTGVNDYAFLWTSTPYNAEQKKYFGIYVSEPDIIEGNAHTGSLALPVRCVRESE